MTSQTGWQTIVMHILPNISRSKDNQAIKFGHLIECSMRNISLEKFYTKFLDQWPNVLYSFFLLYGKLVLSKYVETKLQTTRFHLILSFLKKQEEVWS